MAYGTWVSTPKLLIIISLVLFVRVALWCQSHILWPQGPTAFFSSKRTRKVYFRGSNQMQNVSEASLTPYRYAEMLRVAIEEALAGLAEGGIPIGAAVFDRGGKLLGRGHNRRVQENDPSVHGETDAFRKAGRQRSYRDKIMVTTLAPCWYCSGLVRQFGIGTLVVGESVNFRGGIDWLRENGIEVIDLQSQECVELLANYIGANPAVWHEDIGEE
jgi:creatinine deaminase